MSEGHFEKLKKYAVLYVLFYLLISGFLLIGLWYVLNSYMGLEIATTLIGLGIFWISISTMIAIIISKKLLQPIEVLSQAILHISPNQTLVAPPKLEDLKIGHELVVSLARQVYGFASTASNIPKSLDSNTLLDQLPSSIIGFNSQGIITLSNKASIKYLELDKSPVGRNIYEILDLSFSSEDTLDNWLGSIRNSKVSDIRSWERVQIQLPSGLHYIDLSVEFSKKQDDTTETILMLFDHTATYAQDDDALSFIALTVHELRTPLTILRGYIEAMTEELGTSASPEVASFMHRIEASSQNVTTFVSNILNVARIDQNQFSLKLAEVNWQQLLNNTIENLKLRASVRKIEIVTNVDSNIPSVAADTTTITEVINNLVENAIKYTPKTTSGKIVISSKINQDGLVETTVQDFGVGIPVSVIPTLFARFSRNYRTRATVVGNGLGLYLCQSIVSAHKGSIWVRSEEGKGSVFGFTINPYSKLASITESNDNKEMSTTAHGWIKNHSLYRR